MNPGAVSVAARKAAWALGFAITVVLVWRWVDGERLDAGFARSLAALEETGAPKPAPRLADGDSVVRVRIASYNAWALPVWMPGTERVARLPSIPGELATLDPDIITLQEAFHVDFRRFALAYFSDYAVGSGADCTRPMAVLGVTDCQGGLMTLSRRSIVTEVFHEHRLGPDTKLDERLGRKGFLLTALDTPLGPVLVANVHLYAGRAPGHELERMRQARRLAVEIAAVPGDPPVVLAGDLNVVHPDIATDSLPPSEVYRFVLDSLGFTDAFPRGPDPAYTYDAEQNRHAGIWYNRFEGRQIFDYVLVRSSPSVSVAPLGARRILTEEETLSDHFGLVADLELRHR